MKKILSIVLVLMLLVTFAFAGCSKDNNNDEENNNNQNASDKTAEKNDVNNNNGNNKTEEELTIWAFFEGLPKEAADFYSQKSGVKVDYIVTSWADYQVKLASSVGTDEMPDILQLPIHFLGRFAKTGQFANLDDAYGGRELYESYKANTAKMTLELGYFEGTPIGIGWESNVGAYFYREDIARDAFGIESVEEMEAALETWDGFYKLNEMKKPGYDNMAIIAEFERLSAALLGITPQYIEKDTFTFNKELDYAFTQSKKMVDAGMVYLDGKDKTAVINASNSDAFLGNLAESWWVPNCKTFEQSGLWRVAEAPIHFSNGGTWWAVPLNADKEKAWSFLKETFLSEDWLYDNLPKLGNYIANNNVMDRAIQEEILHDSYFGDQVIGQKFIDISENTTEVKPKSEYFMTIHGILNTKIREYAWDGVYETLEETYDAIEDEINSVFPDIDIVR